MRRYVLLLTLALAAMAHAAEPVLTKLPNGVRVVSRTTGASQLVSVELLLDCSAADEPWRFKGMRQVLLFSMLQGSLSMDGETIRRNLDDAGGFLVARVQQDTIQFSATVPAEALPVALSALSEVVCRPQLTDAGIRTAIARAKTAAATMPTGLAETAARYADAWIYRAHPYLTGGLGDEETLENLTPDLIRAAYDYFVLPDATVVGIVGHSAPEVARAGVEKTFGAWRSDEPREVRGKVTAPVLLKSQSLVNEVPTESTCVLLAFPVCGSQDPDFATLRVLHALLGGGTGSRTFRAIREQGHLAYETATRLSQATLANTFSLYALTNSRDLEATKTAITDQLVALQVTPVSDGELQRAKAYVKGQYLISHQSNAQEAYDLACGVVSTGDIVTDRAWLAKIDAVSVEEVQRVARAYFTRFALVVLIPQSVKESAG